MSGPLPFLPAERIAARVVELAAELSARWPGDFPRCLCVLKGGFIFAADLVRALGRPDVTVDFVRVASYGDAITSSGAPIFLVPPPADLAGQDVLVIEDIVDSGLSWAALKAALGDLGVKSAAICCLVDKRERRLVEVEIDFAGFVVERGFLIGYGLDCAEKSRCLPDLWSLDPETFAPETRDANAIDS